MSRTWNSLRSLVALSIIPGISCRRAQNLVKAYGTKRDIFSLNKKELTQTAGIGESTALALMTFNDWDKVDHLLEATHKTGARLISILDPEYPPLLKQIYDPPILLWGKGNIDCLSLPGIAVVGTREPTNYGCKVTRELISGLKETGLCIFSGLAYGIDGVAHHSALEAGLPTVAVLGSGIDHIYPRTHSALSKKIIDAKGAVISEYAPGTPPDGSNFPERNRIVSGLSLGVLVIESGCKGGSMITAEMALDQNREVFAVPHDIGSSAGSGCNYLIKKGGAKLIQSVSDILEELPVPDLRSNKAVNTPQSKSWRNMELDDNAQKICIILEKGAKQIDQLSDELLLDTSPLLVSLLQLEMDGVVTQRAGKVFELKN